uniref:OTU domain-containing protein n=1 Tax=Panagrolaimus sp. ES5 TaxID=591445 RepID=A0AC34GPA8_9BILA
MTVLNPTKAKKSAHREKTERTRTVNNTGHCTGNEVPSHVSHSPVPADLKKPFGTSARTSTDSKKATKKISFEKQAGSTKQCALKPGCSGLSSSKPSSFHQSSPQYKEAKEEEGAEACNSDDEYGSGFLNDELERRFAQRLYDVRGLQIKEVKGDGACMFRAVAAQVYGDEEKHMDVRLGCIEYIARNREHFSQFITEDFDAYLTRKRQAEVHGNHVELQAISEIYGRQIEIYEYDTKPVITFHPITVEANAVGEHPPLMLSYHGNVHYNSVIDPYRPVNAPINPVVFPNLNTNMHERISYKNAVNASELTHIEEQMLNDKLKMTDYEGTEDELTKQITKESYMDYVRSLERKSQNQEKRKNEADLGRTNERSSPKYGNLSSQRNLFLSPKKAVIPRMPSAPGKVASGSGATKRSFPDLSSESCETFSGPKIKKNESSLSLPNIHSEFNKSIADTESSLPRSISSPSSIFQEPTCTKTLLNTSAGKNELTVFNEKEAVHDKDQQPISEDKKDSASALDTVPSANPPAKISLYEELLASTAFDDDDESQSLAQALALSQQEYYSNLT